MTKELPPIGGVKLDGPFVFGPMAGITDAPMRRITRRLGASLCYTEMISSKGLWYNDEKTWRLLYMYGDEHFAPDSRKSGIDASVSDTENKASDMDAESEAPTAVQIFGHEPEIMAAACEKIRDLNNSIVDINMGCPVPKIFKNGDGSAMMLDPDQAGRVVEACVKAAGKPVTVKIRLGVDNNHINCVEMAKTLEQAGAAAIALHARTREQFYSGDADWKWIGEVKAALHIPVIGNGDVRSAEDALRMMKETGCDYVMVSRAALGNPWLFQELNATWNGELKAAGNGELNTTRNGELNTTESGEPSPEKPDLEAKKALMLQQLSDMCDLKGEYAAVREMRKVIGWYIKGMPGSAAVRGMVNQIDSRGEMEGLINNLR